MNATATITLNEGTHDVTVRGAAKVASFRQGLLDLGFGFTKIPGFFSTRFVINVPAGYELTITVDD